MDCAKKILFKYGWQEGEGLGKNRDGISKPLKASLKFDKAGLGEDQAASDFNNHWWVRVFNEAASNVSIMSANESVIMDLKDHSETLEITTKGYSLQKLKKAKKNEKYANFLQSATLTNTGDVIDKPDRITANDIKVKKFKQLTDEELFKACGGRTAHKGARHGLKLSGKLARLEKQEQEMLSKILGKKNEAVEKAMVQKNKITKNPEVAEEIAVHVKENKVKEKKKRVNNFKPNDQHIEPTKKKRQINAENGILETTEKKTKASELNDRKEEKLKRKKDKKSKKADVQAEIR